MTEFCGDGDDGDWEAATALSGEDCAAADATHTARKSERIRRRGSIGPPRDDWIIVLGFESCIRTLGDGGDGRVGEFFGVVTDIREESRDGGRQRWQMALDRTEFAVGDVGVLEAVARSGTRLVVPVLGVVRDGAGEVWHVVEKPLAAGTAVTGRVGAGFEG